MPTWSSNNDLKARFAQSFVDSKSLTLVGKFVRLLPLTEDHERALIQAANDGELWKLKVTEVPNESGMAEYIELALTACARGEQTPFVVQRLSDKKIVGSTRFYQISTDHRNLSIGYTWYCASAQRTAINTETKLLMLEYAFEQALAISVRWHTYHANVRSQAAIRRLGAKFEGVLRNDRILRDGRVRHTHCYSLLANEWPHSKARLQKRLYSN